MTWDAVARPHRWQRQRNPADRSRRQAARAPSPMNTDRIQAEWLAARIACSIDGVIWPTVSYGHYPAFVDYAGSVSLSASTFESLIQEIAAGILGYGCRALLVLDTGISTLRRRSIARWGLRQSRCAASSGSRRPAVSPRRRGACRATTRQPCRRTRNLNDAGAGAASGRDGAGRSQSSLKHETPGALTRSDAASPNYSRSGRFRVPTLQPAPRAKSCSRRWSMTRSSRPRRSLL